MDTAVILAGGLGTRLRPLTENTPKPLLPVGGKPTIEWTLDMLHHYNFKKVILTLSYRAEKIQEYFGEQYKGMKLIHYIEDEPLGNAGALLHVSEHLTKAFFQIHGDLLANIDIQEMHHQHVKKMATGSLALAQVADPSPYSAAVLNGGVVTKYVYKPKKDEAPSNLVFIGASILEPGVLEFLKKKKVNDLDHDILMPLIEARKVAGYIYKGSWFTIDTIEKYARANAFWQR